MYGYFTIFMVSLKLKSKFIIGLFCYDDITCVKMYLDQKFMRIAINLANENIGKVSPNPSVGCVIVVDNVLVSQGVTQKGGRPHAEKNAIDNFKGEKSLLKSSTLYSTLEPCFHHGATPPCVNLILELRIKRVVIAVLDPDDRMCGNGLSCLRENGVEVEYGVCREEAIKLNIGFFATKILYRPHITLKIATTLDGKIASKYGHSKWISCEKSRRFAHLLRMKSDVILIGRGTLDKDDPSLDCRLKDKQQFSPRVVILSNSDLDCSQYNLFKREHMHPVIIITGQSTIITNHQNIEIIRVSDIKGSMISIDFAVSKLGLLGMTRVLVEGGKKIASSLLRSGMIDEIIWFHSNCIAGNDGIPAFDEMYFSEVLDFYSFDRVDVDIIGNSSVTTLISSHSHYLVQQKLMMQERLFGLLH